jgi:hypothetical protein
MKLHVADDLQLPPDVVTVTFGVLAMRGAGKSNLDTVKAEGIAPPHSLASDGP